MPSCAVAGCRNYSTRSKGTNISYYTFPKESSICNQWVRVCKHQDSINIKHARICSSHFTPEDFMRNLKAELLGLNPRKVLKSNAVPTINLDEPPSASTSSLPSIEAINHIRIEHGYAERSDSYAESPCSTTKYSLPDMETSNRTTAKYGFLDSRENITEAFSSRKCVIDMFSDLPPGGPKIDKKIQTDRQSMLLQEQLEKKVNRLDYKYRLEREKVLKLKSKIRLLHLNLRKKNKKIQEIQCKYNAKIKEDVRMVLHQIFSDSQISDIFKSTKRTCWKPEDLKRALAVRKTIKRDLYIYLKKELNVPLPAISTLTRWTSGSSSLQESSDFTSCTTVNEHSNIIDEKNEEIHIIRII